MIYTVTFNPSLDYVVYLDSFIEGIVNRTNRERIFVGGKGINVSVVLRNLGIESRALGFIAGFTGEQIVRQLQQMGCQTDFISLSRGFTRINIKMKTAAETEVNGQGPEISEQALGQFFAKLQELEIGDFLVLAGSIPSTLPNDMYEKVMQHIEKQGVHCVVDATSKLLLNVLVHQPFLIKPNHHELAEIFQVDIHTEEEFIFYGKRLQEMGARNVLISLAKEGAILLTEAGDIYQAQAPVGIAVNSTGAGDSMIAGFLAAYTTGQSLAEAFQMGVAAGSATAFSEGLATKAAVGQISRTIRLIKRREE